MLQKVVCGKMTTISKFKANPNTVLAEAKGEAVAIASHNEIQFYAVPASLYEEMIQFIEFSQRGTTDLNPLPASFHLNQDKMDSIVKKSGQYTEQSELKDENYLEY